LGHVSVQFFNQLNIERWGMVFKPLSSIFQLYRGG